MASSKHQTFEEILQNYEGALNGLENDPPENLLPCLLARDQVDAALQQIRVSDQKLEELVEQDVKLREFASNCTLDNLSELSKWRESRRPPPP